jgi:hypothetical protein
MVSGQLHGPAALPPGKYSPGRIGDCVGPRAGLHAVEEKKIFPLPGNPLQYKMNTLLLIIIIIIIINVT